MYHLGLDQVRFGYVIAVHLESDIDKGNNHILGKEGVNFVVY
jgi:hypothetical protein